MRCVGRAKLVPRQRRSAVLRKSRQEAVHITISPERSSGRGRSTNERTRSVDEVGGRNLPVDARRSHFGPMKGPGHEG